ncbi:MAG: pentapeptide repeat-containing protein [Bdellovibrionota bacterium]
MKLILALLLMTLSVFADDNGARMQGEFCVNSEGKPALNLREFIECSWLTNQDLDGQDFSGLKMDGSILKGGFLKNTNFLETSMVVTDVSYAGFFEAKMSKVIMTGALLISTNFEEADLTEAQLFGVLALGASFNRAKLTGTSFQYADLRAASFKAALVRGTDFRHAHLEGADLAAVLLDENTKFGDAIFDDSTKLPFTEAEALKRQMVKSTDATFPPHTGMNEPRHDWPTYDLSGGEDVGARYVEERNQCEVPDDPYMPASNEDFWGQCGSITGSWGGVDVSSRDLVAAGLADQFAHANFSGARLQSAGFRGIFTYTDFRAALLQNAKLAHIYARGAYFSHASMEHANLYDTDLYLAHFVESWMRGGDLRYARAVGADFQGADLTAALLQGGDFRVTNLAKARSLQGAEYDSKTRLPFSDEEAASLGMIRHE